MGKLVKSKYNWIGFFIAPISAIIRWSRILIGFDKNQYISELYNISCLGWFTYYYLGLLLGNNLIKKQYKIKKLLLFYVLSIIIQMFEGYGWFVFGEISYGSQFKLSTFLTSSIFLLISYWYIKNNNINDNNKFMIMIGDCSFGIYISHIMIIKILGKIPFYSQIPFLLNSIIVLIVTMICVLVGQKICGDRISKWLGLK